MPKLIPPGRVTQTGPPKRLVLGRGLGSGVKVSSLRSGGLVTAKITHVLGRAIPVGPVMNGEGSGFRCDQASWGDGELDPRLALSMARFSQPRPLGFAEFISAHLISQH